MVKTFTAAPPTIDIIQRKSYHPAMVLASFLFFLLTVSGIIGFVAARKSQKTETDYFLAGQNVSPYFLALSSAASKYSGFMFAGFMGLAYAKGTTAIWFVLGLLTGHAIIYPFIVSRLQQMNTGGWALSIAELITFWHGENRVWLRRFIGLITLFFLSIYAAAQLKAGGKALEVALGQPAYIGILLSVVIILFYCWAGGIRASIWTDSAQMATMTLSMLLIIVMAAVNEGGLGNLFTAFMHTGLSSNEVALFPQDLSIGGMEGLALYFLGTVTFGLCTIGQPHILIRPMALQTPQDTKKFIISNYAFEVVFMALTLAVGLSTRVILRDAASFDAELSLFLSALKILPPIAVGLVLAGAFSSTLSTADSQILSCSASLMRDLPEPPKHSLLWAKSGTVGTAILATLVALFAQDNVYSLVTFAFSGLGTSIGTLLILRIFNCKISEWGAIAVGLAGGAGVVVWKSMGLSSIINESLIGFTAAFGTYFILRLFTPKPKQ